MSDSRTRTQTDTTATTTTTPMSGNTAPTATPAMGTIIGERDYYYFGVDAFGYADADGDALQSITIVRTPEQGALFLDSIDDTPVQDGDVIEASLLPGLSYIPFGASADFSASFVYTVFDGTSHSEPAVFDITVEALSEAAVLFPLAGTGREITLAASTDSFSSEVARFQVANNDNTIHSASEFTLSDARFEIVPDATRTNAFAVRVLPGQTFTEGRTDLYISLDGGGYYFTVNTVAADRLYFAVIDDTNYDRDGNDTTFSVTDAAQMGAFTRLATIGLVHPDGSYRINAADITLSDGRFEVTESGAVNMFHLAVKEGAEFADGEGTITLEIRAGAIGLGRDFTIDTDGFMPNANPTAQGRTVSIAVDAVHVFSTGDFGFADSDPADSLASITVLGLPAGALTLDGEMVAIGDVINAGRISDLVFTPQVATEDYATQLQFSASDGIADSTLASITIAVSTATAANVSRVYVHTDDAATGADITTLATGFAGGEVSDARFEIVDDGGTLTLAIMAGAEFTAGTTDIAVTNSAATQTARFTVVALDLETAPTGYYNPNEGSMPSGITYGDAEASVALGGIAVSGNATAVAFGRPDDPGVISTGGLTTYLGAYGELRLFADGNWFYTLLSDPAAAPHGLFATSSIEDAIDITITHLGDDGVVSPDDVTIIHTAIIAIDNVQVADITATAATGSLTENLTDATATGIVLATGNNSSAITAGDFNIRESDGAVSTRFGLVDAGSGDWNLVLTAGNPLDFETEADDDDMTDGVQIDLSVTLGGRAETATDVTVNLLNVIEAASLNPRALSIEEAVPYTFSAGDFGYFEDGRYQGAGEFDSLTLTGTSLPALFGGLRLDGAAVTIGQTIAYADIGNLVLTPPNTETSYEGTIGFSVTDTTTLTGGVLAVSVMADNDTAEVLRLDGDGDYDGDGDATTFALATRLPYGNTDIATLVMGPDPEGTPFTAADFSFSHEGFAITQLPDAQSGQPGNEFALSIADGHVFGGRNSDFTLGVSLLGNRVQDFTIGLRDLLVTDSPDSDFTITKDSIFDTTAGGSLVVTGSDNPLRFGESSTSGIIATVTGTGSERVVTYNGTYGTLTIDSQGAWNYALDASSLALAALPDGASATDSFTIAISDPASNTAGGNLRALHDVSVTVTDAGTVGNIASEGARASVVVNGVEFRMIDPGAALNGQYLEFVSAEVESVVNNPALPAIGRGLFEVEIYTTTGATQAAIVDLWNDHFIGRDMPNTVAKAEIIEAMQGIQFIHQWNDSASHFHQFTGGSDVADLSVHEGFDSTAGGYLRVTGAPNPAALEFGSADDSGASVTATATARTVSYAGAYGTLVIDEDGDWVYTLDTNNPDVIALETGDEQFDSFTVSITDTMTGVREQQSLDIRVAGNTPVSFYIDHSVGIDMDEAHVLSRRQFDSGELGLAADAVSFTITDSSYEGLLEISRDGGASWERALNGATFTQSDIDAGMVRVAESHNTLWFLEGVTAINTDIMRPANAGTPLWVEVNAHDGANYSAPQYIEFLFREDFRVNGTESGVVVDTANNIGGTRPGESPFAPVRVSTGLGSSSITTGAGDDIIRGGLGNDRIDLGGGGNDDVIYRFGVNDDGLIYSLDGGDAITGFMPGRDVLVLSSRDARTANMSADAIDELQEFVDQLDNGYQVHLDSRKIIGTIGTEAGHYEVTGLDLIFATATLLPSGQIAGPVVSVDFDTPIRWDHFAENWLGGYGDGAYRDALDATASRLVGTEQGRDALVRILGLDLIVDGSPEIYIGNPSGNNGFYIPEGEDAIIAPKGGSNLARLDSGAQQVVIRLADDGVSAMDVDGFTVITGFNLAEDRLTLVDTDTSDSPTAPSFDDLVTRFDDVYMIYLSDGGHYLGIGFNTVDPEDPDGAVGVEVLFDQPLLFSQAEVAALFNNVQPEIVPMPVVTVQHAITNLDAIDDLFGDALEVVDTLPPELV